MAKSFSSEAKIVIRRKWDKPLLKFLSKKIDAKLTYMGLPSPEAEDVVEWIEYLDNVVAFQCRDHKAPSNASQSREAIEELEEKLANWQRKGLLEDFTVYDGYIEEVVLRGIDNWGLEFSQNQTVHIYNLDFCNKINFPLKYTDREGNPKKAYKFNAVNELLQFQKKLNEDNQKFIMFLTIQNSHKGQNFNDYLKSQENPLLQDYIQACKSLKKGPDKRARLLRLFIIDTLQDFFRNYDFVPYFLPTVFYRGLKNAELLHFTVIGTRVSPEIGKAKWYQKLGNLYKENILQPENDSFKLMVLEDDESLIKEKKVDINPVQKFSNSSTHEKLWSSKK